MNQLIDKEKQRRNRFFILLLGALFILSILQVNITVDRLVNSVDRGWYIMQSLFPPTISNYSDIFIAAIESIQIAIIGTVLGIVLSLILAIFVAKNTTPHPLFSYIAKGLAAFVRAVPALIWALLFIVAVGLGPTAGIFAIGVNSVGMLVKIYSESIEEIDQGAIEALQATGASKLQIITQGIIPSVARIFISWSFFRFEINIRYSSVLGVVGAGGIGWELIRASRVMDYGEAIGITIIIFVIVLLSENLTTFLKERIELAPI